MKIQRNDPCSCGSGKKFKKCCMSSVVQTKTVEQQKSTPQYVHTTTGERIMPVRLYYTIKNYELLIERLNQTKCMVKQTKHHYAIHYEKEAKKIDFPATYKAMARQIEGAIVLARCKITDKNSLLVDVNSHERALKLVEFINQVIPKHIIEITEAATYNDLFFYKDQQEAAKKVAYDRYDELFAPEKLVRLDTEEKINPAMAIKHESNLPEVKNNTEAKAHTLLSEPLPRADKFPIFFYEDGISHFRFLLVLRAKVAFERSRGNPGFTINDAIMASIPKGSQSD